jgi:hypothetical protein
MPDSDASHMEKYVEKYFQESMRLGPSPLTKSIRQEVQESMRLRPSPLMKSIRQEVPSQVAVSKIGPEDVLSAVRAMDERQRRELAELLGVESTHPMLCMPRGDQYQAVAMAAWKIPTYSISKSEAAQFEELKRMVARGPAVQAKPESWRDREPLL